MSPGFRGRPRRSQLVRAERGNPVGVRPWAGKPTVRGAQLPGGYRMAEKRMPVAERQRETASQRQSSSWRDADNRPDTGPRGPARKGADAVR